MRRAWTVAGAVLALAGGVRAGAAQSSQPGAPIQIARTARPIVVDGSLQDEGWLGAARVDTWYEVSPGDNLAPRVRSVGYLTYDDSFFYAAFEFFDPSPASIRAPVTDRDNLSNSIDYACLELDTRNDGHSAMEFCATASGVQFDAMQDDQSGEDQSPDFFWDSAARITATGWSLEVRIPFSTLRYSGAGAQAWGIILTRNYPRDFRYQLMSTRLPRGGNCFICRESPLTGLDGLPGGRHLILAPYVAGSQTALPIGDLGTPLATGSVHTHGGADLKWTPDAQNVLDMTFKPDFSQIEADTAQISANTRFALFFPEKRPFFLEGVNLFSTPIQAVYTRTITDPNGGARMTGKVGDVAYTALFAQDAGGGTAIIPGSNGSSSVNADFTSIVLIGRVKKELGNSYVSALVTDRDAGASGHNRVVGPDFQWRTDTEVVRGQWLVSDTKTPDRPDLIADWNGQRLTSSAAHVEWSHSTTHFNSFAGYNDFGNGFRADSGFVPQVGYRETIGSLNWTVRPTGFVSQLQTFVNLDRQTDRSGVLITDGVEPGAAINTQWNGLLQVRWLAASHVLAGNQQIFRRQLAYVAQFSPSRQVAQIGVNGWFGSDADYDNARPGRGGSINANATLHPTDHLELLLLQNASWLNVDAPARPDQRLFTAQVSRVRATYSFTARAFVRVIGQYVSTDRDQSLYADPTTTPRSADFSGSALVAYKLNWQSVLFVGYGDDRDLPDNGSRLVPSDRQVFVKISYAIQR